MEVDFEQPSSGSLLESPKIWISVFKPKTIKGYIFKNKRINCRFLTNNPLMCFSSLHDKYVIVPAGKASNNIVFVCKSYYFVEGLQRDIRAVKEYASDLQTFLGSKALRKR
jgi:hypothetical protein